MLTPRRCTPSPQTPRPGPPRPGGGRHQGPGRGGRRRWRGPRGCGPWPDRRNSQTAAKAFGMVGRHSRSYVAASGASRLTLTASTRPASSGTMSRPARAEPWPLVFRRTRLAQRLLTVAGHFLEDLQPQGRFAEAAEDDLVELLGAGVGQGLDDLGGRRLAGQAQVVALDDQLAPRPRAERAPVRAVVRHVDIKAAADGVDEARAAGRQRAGRRGGRRCAS